MQQTNNYNPTELAALDLHRKNQGKIETGLRVNLDNKADLSLSYTPGVAAVCLEIARQPEKANEYTMKGRTVAVITDGSAVLGLGNIGPLAAMPVMEGKCALFKKFAGIDAVPICLDTQEPQEIINIITKLAPSFGGINLEDIAAPNCFEIEKQLKNSLSIPVMHDDQHGTAVVVLSGLINALKIKNESAENQKVIINGAGAAGTAIAELLHGYGFTNIILCDSKGIISKQRTDLNSSKQLLLKFTNRDNLAGSLSDAINQSTIFIGVSGANLLTAEMVKSMSAQPIIFALANPIPEIMPDIAKNAGAYIVATGRSDFPNQVNNVLAFPGIFKGAIENKVSKISDKMLVQAAEALAACVKEPNPEKIIPDPFQSDISLKVAEAIRNS